MTTSRAYIRSFDAYGIFRLKYALDDKKLSMATSRAYVRSLDPYGTFWCPWSVALNAIINILTLYL